MPKVPTRQCQDGSDSTAGGSSTESSGSSSTRSSPGTSTVVNQITPYDPITSLNYRYTRSCPPVEFIKSYACDLTGVRNRALLITGKRRRATENFSWRTCRFLMALMLVSCCANDGITSRRLLHKLITPPDPTFIESLINFCLHTLPRFIAFYLNQFDQRFYQPFMARVFKSPAGELYFSRMGQLLTDTFGDRASYFVNFLPRAKPAETYISKIGQYCLNIFGII